jgi:aminopeptidase N
MFMMMGHSPLEVIMLKRLSVAAVLLVALLLVPAASAAARAAGTPGTGDPFFPLAGNGGYDVARYALSLSYVPATDRLQGRVVITATAMQALSQFDLDLRGFSVRSVRVDGAPAVFWRSGQELVVVPAAAVAGGASFTVDVRYDGKPQVVTDPDGSIEGWVPTDDGAFVVGEPQGSPSWFPVNDTPLDKALFDFRITVPRGITALANGALVSKRTAAQRTTWTWTETDPMAPYLATATLGRFDLSRSSVDGVPSYVAVDRRLHRRAVLERLPAMVRFYVSVFGPYPFNAVGAVVDRAPRVGYALETQTKPVFDSMPDEATLAHELSHQWFGDSVTLSTWPDIWLHEGFATWAEWLWSEHRGMKSAHDIFAGLYATPKTRTAFWNPPPGALGTPVDLFDGTVYERGAMTLQALREKIGDPDFFAVLRAWAQDHRYGNVTTAQFIDLAEQVSGTDLTTFFQAWLYQEGKPATW